MNAAEAIARSISHTEIVTLKLTEDRDASRDEITIREQTELVAECDDSVETERGTEYWGTTEDGDDWRVHVIGRVAYL